MTAAEGRAAAERAERLIENVLAALNAVDPAGIMAAIGGDPTEPWPEAGDEQRIEAEEIARRIRRQERGGGGWLTQRKVAKIVRSVCEEWFEVRVRLRDARATAELICIRRVFELIGDTVAEAAAGPLGDGRAALNRHPRYAGEFPAVELVPEKSTAARLLVSIDFDAQVTCMVEGGHAHEVFSPDPAQIAAEVQGLVAALVAGTYHEEIRERPNSTTTRALWPGGGSSTLDVSQDAGGPLTEWRRRAYDPY